MSIDPLQILQVTMYSKFIQEYIESVLKSKTGITFFILAIVLYKIASHDRVEQMITDFIDSIQNANDSVLTIPQHKRSYKIWAMGSARESTQPVYSLRFRALNHYVAKRISNNNKDSNISSMVEVIKKEFDQYRDTETMDFLLLPVQKDKIKICDINNIYLEILVDREQKEDEKDRKKTYSNEKFYTYKISIPGKNKFHILDSFMKKQIEEYEKDMEDKDTAKQHIYEYITSEVDDDNRTSKKFLKYPFCSNKFLDKNIFFDGKARLIEYIDRFIKVTDDKNRYEQEYEDAGVTFKAGILMYGPPGCGKSCTIRGILNRTGRQGILIPWSKIRTCGELCSLIRNPTINNKEYRLRDVCFIVEDFDANSNEVLKARTSSKSTTTSMSQISSVTKDELDLVDEEKVEDLNKTELINELNKTKKLLETAKLVSSTTNDDLTLECVLNLLDGIVELHHAMFIFTTNHLENIDPAFLRPGRIDYILEFKKASVETIREMVEYRFRSYNIDLVQHEEQFDKMVDEVLSPAEVQNICFKYSADNINDCIDELVHKCK